MQNTNRALGKAVAIASAGALLSVSVLAGCSSNPPASSNSSSNQPAASNTATQSSNTATAPSSSSSNTVTTQQPQQQAQQQPAADSKYIGEDTAMKAALQHAGISESQCAGLHAEFDADHAPIHYDVEFKFDGKEYDYDIDATTGAVISVDSEIDD